MFEIGRLCVKLAGRDAKGSCLIVDVLDGNFVLVDGQVRRKKCNIKHLEPLQEVVKIKKNASHTEVVKALDSLGIKVTDTKKKEQKERPRRQRRGKAKPMEMETAVQASQIKSEEDKKVKKK